LRGVAQRDQCHAPSSRRFAADHRNVFYSVHRLKRPLWVLVALLLAHFSIIVRHHARPLITDELYYAAKARYVAEHHTFPRAGPRERDIAAGRVWGTTDWRPPGYPVFLALVGGSDIDHDEALRLRVTIVQFLLLAALLIATFLFVDARARWPAALLFGLSPWPFEFANDIGPDAINAFLIGTALLLFWRTRGAAWSFVAMLMASATLLFRPEMIAMAPVIAFVVWFLRRERRWRDALAMLFAFAIIVSVQVAYRTAFTGEPGVFGPLRLTNAGAFAWTRTWLGTEKEAYDFVYAVTEGRRADLPSRAFGDAREREEVARAVRMAHERGYSPEVDAIFTAVAEKRRREKPLLVAAVRAMNVVQLWIHLETNPPILDALTPVPRIIRRPILGILLLLKIAAVILGCIGAGQALRKWRHGEADALDALTILMFAYVVARTLLTGVVLDWRVHRYVASAWIPMLWCASIPCRGVARLRSSEELPDARPEL
jgi:hypothetical protein